MRQPLDIPVSGQCDGTGAGTVVINAPVEYWCAIYLAVEVTGGTPSWTVRESGPGGLPYIFGSGTQTLLGPFVIPPRKILSLTLTGAAANAGVDGKVLGWAAPSFGELPPALPTASSVNITGGVVNATITGTPAVTISGTPTVQFAPGQNVTFTNAQIAVLNVAGNLLNTNQIPTSLGSWAVAGIAGTIVSQTVTVPTATHAIQLTVDVDCSIAIRGSTSLAYYSKNQFATVSTGVARQGNNATFEVPINTGIETSYEIRIVKADGTSGTARAAAILTSECVTVKTDIGDPIRVASRIDHTQIIEKGETSPVANTWTQIVQTSACTPPNQIQWINFGAVNGTGGSTRIFWRIKGSNSGATVIIYRATLATGDDINRDLQYDPVLFWSRLNNAGFNSSDVVAIEGFAQGANCFVDATIMYLLV